MTDTDTEEPTCCRHCEKQFMGFGCRDKGCMCHLAHDLATHLSSILEDLKNEKKRADDYRDELAKRTGPESYIPNAYPDSEYPIRVLQAELDSNREDFALGQSEDGSAEALAKVMNEAAAERIKILEKAIAALRIALQQI